MAWRQVNLLWLLIAVAAFAVFLFGAAARRRRALEGFAEARLLDRLVIGLSSRRRAWAALLRSATLALVVAAAAGPLWGFHWEEVHREGIDLVIALDTSRSMLAGDVKPNRIERAKLAILDLVGRLQGDRVGLVAFAGTGFLECPLTLDYAAFERSLRATQVGIIPRGGTAVARAIETSLAALESRQGKHEAIVLITDGEDHEGDPEAAAKLAAERGVKVYTVGIGTTEGELIPTGAQAGYVKDRGGQVVKSRLEEGVLEKVALATGGAYVRGIGESLGLDELFDQHIAKMERRTVGSGLERRFEQRFQIPLVLALLLLVIESLLGIDPRSLVSALRRLGRSRQARAAAFIMMLPWIAGWPAASSSPGAEGRRLYDEGKFSEAAAKYREALVEEPDSALLRFNLGAASYREGKYDEAMTAFSQVAADEGWTARAAYNLGNALYQVGEKAESGDAQAALTSYQQALLAYRRAMAADPRDEDSKYGHELVAQRMRELERKIEEQKQKEEQQKQQQKQQQEQHEQQPDQQEQNEQQQAEQPQDQQQPGQEQSEQEQGEEASEPPDQEQQQEPQSAEGGEEQAQPDASQEQGGQPQQQEDAAEPPEQAEDGAEGQGGGQQAASQDEQAGSAGAAEAGEPDEGARERQAAQAILDLAGSEEIGPEEIERGGAVAGEGAPAKDW